MAFYISLLYDLIQFPIETNTNICATKAACLMCNKTKENPHLHSWISVHFPVSRLKRFCHWFNISRGPVRSAGRPDCDCPAPFDTGFNVRKILGQFETKLTDSEELDTILHPVVLGTHHFQHPHHHCFRRRQQKTGSRGGIIDTIINIHVIIHFVEDTVFLWIVC